MLIGPQTRDDAGVYQLSDDLAMIQTLDFFTPIVDDPFEFGKIAAVNALSDIYAMGGEPKTAMNIVAFPAKQMDLQILQAILAGGIQILSQTGTALLGGHSVQDEELKYGLSVTGFVHPKKVIANRGLRSGDSLILTKPLGTGIINTAIKAGLAKPKLIETAIDVMTTLNRSAARIMKSFPVSACTDVTGFGLLGHLAEMIQDSSANIILDSQAVPLMDQVIEFASMGLVPAGSHANRKFWQDMVEFKSSVSPVLRDILFDPQTSGGLIIGIDKSHTKELLSCLKDQGIGHASIIGQVVPGQGRISIS